MSEDPITAGAVTEVLSVTALEARVRELEETVADYQQQLSAAKAAEQRARRLFEHLLYEVHIWQIVRDAEGEIQTWRLLEANPAALKVWGKQLDEVVGKTTDEIFGVNATEQFMPLVQKIFASDEPYTWEQFFPGTGQTLMMVSIPVGDAFISSGIDVTAIKQTETALNETLLQLTESIEAANVGLWDWDLTTDRVHFSAEWKSQIGYADNEIEDRFEEWRDRVHPEDLDASLKSINDHIASDKLTYESEFRLRHKDGSYRWILAHASMIRGDSGAGLRMVGSHIDITKRKELEMAFLQSQKMEALGTLAGGIAHDFNNLLVPILGYADLAARKMESDDPHRKYLQHISVAAERARELVQKILIVSRKSTSVKQPVSMIALVEEVLVVVQASAPKGIAVHTDWRGDLPAVEADSSKIYQVVLNLCTNAVQAMGDKGRLDLTMEHVARAPTLTASAQAEQGYVRLRLRDEGMGMDRDTLDHIFDPFFTTKNQGEHRGTGLGLSIVSSVIAEHKGVIDVDSVPGKGSVFTVWLPVSAENAASKVEENAVIHVRPGDRALLVDDEAMVRSLGTAMLEDLGYTVESFADGASAVAVMQSAPARFSLVVTDFAMPGMSGPELISAVRAINGEVPILMITGYSNRVANPSAAQVNCDGLLRKPYDLNQLRAAIAAITPQQNHVKRLEIGV